MIRATDSNCYPYLSAAAFTIHQRIYLCHPQTSCHEAGGWYLTPICLMPNWGGWSLTGIARLWPMSRRPTWNSLVNQVFAPSQRHLDILKAVPAYRIPSPCWVLQVIRICWNPYSQAHIFEDDCAKLGSSCFKSWNMLQKNEINLVMGYQYRWSHHR